VKEAGNRDTKPTKRKRCENHREKKKSSRPPPKTKIQLLLEQRRAMLESACYKRVHKNLQTRMTNHTSDFYDSIAGQVEAAGVSVEEVSLNVGQALQHSMSSETSLPTSEICALLHNFLMGHEGLDLPECLKTKMANLTQTNIGLLFQSSDNSSLSNVGEDSLSES